MIALVVVPVDGLRQEMEEMVYLLRSQVRLSLVQVEVEVVSAGGTIVIISLDRVDLVEVALLMQLLARVGMVLEITVQSTQDLVVVVEIHKTGIMGILVRILKVAVAVRE
jgi:hypothetical protein